jgi:hypothetical protein
MTYNHAFTVAFAVPASEYEDWSDSLTNEKDKIISALERRIQMLKDNDAEFMEALDGFDTYEEDN